MKGQRHFAFGVAAGLALVLSGCAAGGGIETGNEAPSTGEDAIKGGTPASAYPEAVLLDLARAGRVVAACSGALIAPRVVLTAGHCVDGFDGWRVTAPYVGASSLAHAGSTYDYTSTSEEVQPDAHDLGLVFLDDPIALPTYPKIATAPATAGAHVRNIGRIRDGVLSNDALYVSKPLAIEAADGEGFPFDYIAKDRIEPGDSGGPDVLVGSGHHTIVAVNSGAGQGVELLARVDLLASWIASAMEKHGGAAPACAHAPSATGERLDGECDACVRAVCQGDAYCCATKWDATCVGEAKGACGG